jgi:hypothetical protein
MTEGIIYVLKEKSNESKKILEIYLRGKKIGEINVKKSASQVGVQGGGYKNVIRQTFVRPHYFSKPTRHPKK